MHARQLFAAAVLGTLLRVSGAATVSIAEDRMLVVDGTRLFVAGLYENPKDDAVLREAADAGFHLVHAAAEADALNRLAAHNLYAWINTGSCIDLSENEDARAEELGKLVDAAAAHPALLVWEVPDEALWNVWYGAILWRGGEEPDLLAEKIKDLQDEAERERLTSKLERSRALHRTGQYLESEQLADELWSDLGQTSPRPGLGLANAPERAARMRQGMIKGRALMRGLDPAHPVWMNHAPRNQVAQLAQFNEAADIVGCDIYPVPESPRVGHSDLRDRTIASVGAYTRRMQEAAPGKPVWMVLQGFGWGDIQPDQPPEVREQLRRPTRAETRFMAFDAIVHGARGILYWGTAYIEKDSPCWRDLLAVVTELKDLQPVLAAPDADAAISFACDETFGSVDRGVAVLPKQVDNSLWLLLVNEFTAPLTGTLRGLETSENLRYVERYSGEEYTVNGGALRLTVPPLSAAVLQPF